MQYIDHAELVANKCPEFKKLLPAVCQELPLEPALSRQLFATVQDLVQMMSQIDPDDPNEQMLNGVDTLRTALLQFWADTCITSAAMSVVGYGVYTVIIDNATFQFVKTSLTHPKRTDLVMHAFSVSAFLNVEADTLECDFLGEDCGVHYTVHNAEPVEADVIKIGEMIQAIPNATFDDYLNVFND